MGKVAVNTDISILVREKISKGRLKMGLDLVTIYKILRYIHEHPGCKVTDLPKAIKISSSTAVRYIDILEQQDLIEVKGRKPKQIFLTKKGYDALFLFMQLERVLALKIE